MSLWAFVCSVLLCSSVRNRMHPQWEKGHLKVIDEVFLSRWWVFSLTERTEFTEVLSAQFRAHRRPPAYRGHRALLPKMAVRFCEIGWLNVSVGLCVFCSSVYSVRKKNIEELSWGVPSLTKDIFFSHRAHRVHGGFWRTFRAHRRPSAYRGHRGLSTNISYNALWYRLT